MSAPGRPRDIIGIGASAGGVDALRRLFARLPADLPAAVLVVLHRGAFQDGALTLMLGRDAAMPVVQPEGDEPIAHGYIYLAPPDRHMVVKPGGIIGLNSLAKEHHARPAVDPLFVSLAECYGPRVVGVVLTGFGRDGTEGLTAIGRAGGVSIAQSPDEARHESMPLHAIMLDDVDFVASIDDIAIALVRQARGEADYRR